MTAASASDTVVLFLPEVFDSQLVADDRKEPVWPNCLLRNQSQRYAKQRQLAEIIGALKLRAGPVIERFGVPQAYGRMRARAIQAGFSPEQILAWGYDWRRTPAEIVQDLSTRPAPPGDGKIIIMGHGYGGLVAKVLMQAGPAWRDRVEGILYLGTPHHGCDEQLAYRLCTFGWLSPTALRILSQPGVTVPLRSLAVMARPWRHDVPLQVPGVREIDVFAHCFPTPFVWPDSDRIIPDSGDGLHLAICVRTESNEPLETDRFHADLPSCPKLWWYLALHVLGRRLKQLELPWASGAIHIQRSYVSADFRAAGLRFRGEESVQTWIEAQAMTRERGRFEPSHDPARASEILIVNDRMKPRSRGGNYAWVDLTGFRKFVRLTLWASSLWDEARGVPTLLDERLIFVADPLTAPPAGLGEGLELFLGSAGHWLGQLPIALEGQPAKVLRPW
jgi:pimeloyl-ACP methyl ester carboxylesterase